jgi:hypothetical protein
MNVQSMAQRIMRIHTTQQVLLEVATVAEQDGNLVTQINTCMTIQRLHAPSGRERGGAGAHAFRLHQGQAQGLSAVSQHKSHKKK